MNLWIMYNYWKQSGSTYFGNNLAMALAVSGDISEGLITAQFPAAIAPVKGAKEICKG